MSSIPNEKMVTREKAVITADAIATSGKLNDAQADRFIDYVMDVTMLKQMARVIRFRNENLKIDKLGVGARVTVPKTEAKDPGVRVGVSPSQLTLTPQEVMTPFEIGDTFQEINLEGASASDHIVRMMATQHGNDTEELYLNGDTLGAAIKMSDWPGGSSSQSTVYRKDSFLGLFKGWLRLADDGHVVDASQAGIGSSVFGEMIRAMPEKFRRNRNDLRFITSMDLEQLYRERVAARSTGAGDAALSSDAPLKPFGIPLIGAPLFPFQPKIVEHVQLNGVNNSSLRYDGLLAGSVVVTASTLDATPVTPFSSSTDYEVDVVAGTLKRRGGSTIGDGDTVKVTYQAGPQIILTHVSNLVVGIGRDIRVEKDRDIYKGVDQYAITAKVATQIEEVDALVKAVNLATTL